MVVGEDGARKMVGDGTGRVVASTDISFPEKLFVEPDCLSSVGSVKEGGICGLPRA
jgi:hypothetical protein